MFKGLYQRAKSWFARQLVRLFYRVVDPRIEAELAAPDDYIRMQQIRRKEIENHLVRYLGPRI